MTEWKSSFGIAYVRSEDAAGVVSYRATVAGETIRLIYVPNFAPNWVNGGFFKALVNDLNLPEDYLCFEDAEIKALDFIRADIEQQNTDLKAEQTALGEKYNQLSRVLAVYPEKAP